ncbi:MFS transporter [Jannaschia rubra]|uniref:MFS transporter n=1 Tax=Jannaschia rubra TaxID=282197 RepID=UPI00249108C4|nr:MFS transporter [Jannaschia rubra]
MGPGIAVLTLAYVLSQFYRAFLAVLAPDLTADLGLTAADLGRASGIWFLSFAAMQLPVGWALDRVGPRWTAGVLLGAAGGGGAALLSVAGAAWHVDLAMALIGAGCAPVLMAGYVILAYGVRPAIFATLAGAMVGVGSLGNIAASVPLGWAAEVLGWRGAMQALAGVTLATAAGCLVLVRDPGVQGGGRRGSLLDVLRVPALWLVLPMMLVNYAPAAGLRGLWAGPYVAQGYGPAHVGMVTLVMGLAMIAGNFAYAPLDRIFGTRKAVVLTGNLAGAAVLAGLWWVPLPGLVVSTAALAAVGFLGASYAMCMAHGRAFLPPGSVGRGVTLLNLFSIGGVGIMQFATAPLFDAAGGGEAGFRAIFGVFALILVAGCAIYAFAPDSTD